MTIQPEISHYNEAQQPELKAVCELLAEQINNALPDADCKIWHSHPVWFLNGNPIVGYSKQKAGIRLMFWSGADFGEAGLNIPGKKFKDASIFYNAVAEIDTAALQRWLAKARDIQWDYKNIVKRKGVLQRLI
ncbi:DUF1801 domain-containing protein [Rheinheimera oceanensis]|uniref:DUF1801 domain-containing protein n=1 Tax=Rheinheimera oceanensis TaxID=2817449 RepID=UPI00203C2B76|nr:DUF1801 domain-containing protein [Rheinheimera oceanensis]